MGDGHRWRIEIPLRMNEMCLTNEKQALLLIFALELCISTTATGKSIKMLGHIGAFLTSGT